MKNIFSKAKEKYTSVPLPVKVAALYAMCSVIVRYVAFISMPIYTRLISTDEYGYYSVFHAWEIVLVIFTSLNMQNYLYSKGMIRYENNRDKFTSALIGLSGLLTILTFTVYLLFRKQFEEVSGLSLSAMIMMFLLFAFQPAYNFWCSRQRFEYKIGGLIKTTIFITVLTPIITVALIIFFKKINAENLGTAVIAGRVLTSIAVYIPVFLILLKRCGKVFDKEMWKFALRFNLPLIPHFLSTVILQQSDRIMIAKMCGNSDAGIYSVAYSVGVVMAFVNSAIIDTIIPWTYNKLKNKSYNGIASVGTYTILIIMAINILLPLLAPEIIAVMAPSEYKMAIYVIPPVAISNVFTCMFNLFANIEYYYEETKLVALASIGAAIINVILNYIFIQIFGFIAAGYTTVACYVLFALCHNIFMNIVLKKNGVKEKIYNTKLIWILALSAVVCALLIVPIYQYLILRALIVVIIITVMFIKRKDIFSMIANIKINE